MKRKTQTIILALSLLIAVLGFGETAQAISFSGNTATSAPTTIDTFLTYTSGSFANVDVAPGPGSTSLTDLGQFTLTVCSGNNCVENFNTDFILKITFTDPSVAGSPAQFTADISGTISRSGNSINIGNNSLLSITLTTLPKLLLILPSLVSDHSTFQSTIPRRTMPLLNSVTRGP